MYYKGEIVLNNEDINKNSFCYISQYHCYVVVWLFGLMDVFEEDEIDIYINSFKKTKKEIRELAVYSIPIYEIMQTEYL